MSQASTVEPAAQIGAATLPSVAHPVRASRDRVDFIEYFRGLAIVLIASGHASDEAWSRFAEDGVATSWLDIVPAIINGGTLYFVFISGFLYRHVFFERVSYADFLHKKAVQVGLPYLIIGTPLALLHIFAAGFHAPVLKHGVPYGEDWFVDLAVEMSTGAMMIAYWYIPFIFVVFLASPLFDRFIRLPGRWRIVIFAVSLVLAMWIHRPHQDLNPLHSFVYFVNVYLFGILFCEHRAAIMPVLRKPLVIAVLAALVFGVAAYQALVLDFTSSLERSPGDGYLPVGFDAMLVQKYIGILLLCGALARWGASVGGPLGFLAQISFGMFFVHGLVVSALSHIPDRLPKFSLPVVEMGFYSAITLTATIAIVVTVRQVAGRYSRSIIGC